MLCTFQVTRNSSMTNGASDALRFTIQFTSWLTGAFDQSYLAFTIRAKFEWDHSNISRDIKLSSDLSLL